MSGNHPPFTDDEFLYRRLIEIWVTEDGKVDPAAIEFAETSVDRGSLSTPEETLARGRPEEVAVAGVKFGRLPKLFPPVQPSGNPKMPAKTYEVAVVPCPEPDNPAHTHLVTRPQGEAQPKRPSQAMKDKIRRAVADSMEIVLDRQKDSSAS